MSDPVWEYIRSDLFRYAGTGGVGAFWHHYRTSTGFRFSVWLRLSHHRLLPVRLAAVRIARRIGERHGISIPPTTRIGYGLFLGHGMSIVVSHRATIGNNCNLSHFVSIGANEGEAATLGDCVYIGPNCSIVEAVQIGNGATVGAGAVVSRDIPAGATAVGVPARPVHANHPARYIANPWPVGDLCRN